MMKKFKIVKTDAFHCKIYELRKSWFRSRWEEVLLVVQKIPEERGRCIVSSYRIVDELPVSYNTYQVDVIPVDKAKKVIYDYIKSGVQIITEETW